jgi:paraquat-inducible protein B
VVFAQKPRIPIVWAIPIVAALVAAFLAWNTWSQLGPTITITFDAASGLEEGKTQVKYRDVSLGVVKTVTLSPDLSHVVVTAQMDKEATDHLTDGTKFWVESARLDASGVSGLSTLVSGVYVGMLPGPGKPTRTFDGQANPPVLTMNVPGRTYHLRADSLGSLAAGSPLYFRGLQVGEVLGYSLDPDDRGVTIFAFVRAPHDALIRPETHFWNASGIDVSLSASGIKVRTEGLVSVLLGGIAFDLPDGAKSGEPSPEGAIFPLFSSFQAISEGQYTERIPFVARFDGSVEGLAPGAPVLMRGLQLGVVKSVNLEIDLDTNEVEIPVIFEIQPQRAILRGNYSESPQRERAAAMVAHGLRAQLQSGNLLTGSLQIGLDFFPDAPKTELTFENGLPVIPTVPSDIQELKQEATKFVQNLAKAPIGQLVTDLRNGVQSLDRVLASKKVQDGVPELVQNANAALVAARGTLERADTMIHNAGDVIGPDSALRYDLARMIEELTRTARSLSTLADFLERDPNALIFGKEKAP